MAKSKAKEDRYSQEFILFIKFEAKGDISRIRKNRAIEPAKNLKILQDLQENYEKNRDHKNKEYLKLVKERESILNKLTSNDSKEILREYNKPASWEFPLQWYIITDKILYPTSRVKVEVGDNEVLVRVAPEANIRDYIEAYKTVESIQKTLHGNEFKKKRIKKKLNEYLNITKDYGEYKNTEREIIKVHDDPLGSSNKAEKRLELVSKYKPKTVDSLTKQLKEEARQRQVYKRHKKYI